MDISDPKYLRPHNKKIVSDIEDLINQGNHSIFYSEATGLGKSYIMVKLIYDLFMNKRILYISPSISIYHNLANTDGYSYISKNIDMRTYAYFNDHSNIYEIVNNYDVIFVDEAHHLKSDIQGSNIREAGDILCKRGGYFIGLTATPDCLDSEFNNINVKDYFYKSVIGLNVAEAIGAGLFPTIDYTVSIFDKSIIPEGYRFGTDVKSNKLYIKDTVDKYTNIDHWLVYYSTTEEMKRGAEQLQTIFPEYKILTICSKDKGRYNKILKEYENSSKVMLLSVSVLIEGNHIKKTGGVILFRNTRVVRILIQIIGRICNIGREDSPVFIDMIDSIKNIGNVVKMINNSNSQDGKERHKRSIFNISAKSNENIDICEALFGLIQKSDYNYARGYIFKTYKDLSLQLGKGENHVSYMLSRNRDWTVDDVIDFDTGNKCITTEGYTFRNNKDLSVQLNKDPNYVSTVKYINPDQSYSDIIKRSDTYIPIRNYVRKNDKNRAISNGLPFDYIANMVKEDPILRTNDKDREDNIEILSNSNGNDIMLIVFREYKDELYRDMIDNHDYFPESMKPYNLEIESGNSIKFQVTMPSVGHYCFHVSMDKLDDAKTYKVEYTYDGIE